MKLLAIISVIVLAVQPYPASMMWEGSSVEDLSELEPVLEGPTVPEAPNLEMLEGAFSGLPGYFLENIGQHEAEVGAYYSAGDDLAVSFGPSCVAYGLPDGDGFLRTTFRVAYLTDSIVRPRGVQPTTHVTNFLKGDDPSGWVPGVRSYHRVTYDDLWEGVDVVHRFEGDSLKYDIIVAAGVDPMDIRSSYQGDVELCVEAASGDLIIQTPVGILRDTAPYAYQEVDGVRRTVECSYVIDGCTVSFDLEEYDASTELVIDPGLEFGTFFHRETTFTKVIRDGNGDLVLVGDTMDYEIPTTTGVFCQSFSGGWGDAFLARFDSDASDLLVFTFIGGETYDLAYSMAIDANGGYCIVGLTTSEKFPTTSNAVSRTHNGGIYDGWFMWLPKSASSVKYSTFMGGTGIDVISDVIVAENDQVWMSGVTASTGFPTTTDALYGTYQGGELDGFVVRFSLATSDIVYSTFIGADKDDGVLDIELDPNGHVVMLCFANSTNFPTTSGAFQRNFAGGGDAAVMKMHKDGSRIIFSTLLGGTGTDDGNSIAIDDTGDIWLSGLTTSTDFPMTDDAFIDAYNGNDKDAYVARISSDGSALEYATYFAGQSTPEYIKMRLNTTGKPIIMMEIMGGGLCPTTAFIPEAPPDDNLFISWVDFEEGRLLNATYIGGNDMDNPGMFDFFIDADGGYVVAGRTYSDDFPSTNGSYDDTYQKGAGYIIKFGMSVTPWTPPDEPSNVSVSPGNRRATLSWDPPADRGYWPFIGYQLFKGTTSGELDLLVEVNSSFSEYEIGNLVNGQEYFFSLIGISVVGESDMTPEVSVIPFGAPTEPVNLTASGNMSAVLVTWDKPIDNGGRPVEGYNLYRGPWKDAVERYRDLGAENSFWDVNVTVGKSYVYCVEARNSDYTGPMSNVDSAIPYGPPGTPTEVKVMSSHNRLAMTWREPTESGHSPILGYKVYKGTSPDDLEYFADATGLSFSDDTVINGNTYYYAISAFNAAGEGVRSSTAQGVPRGAPTSPTNVTIGQDLGSVWIDWDPPENDGGYTIERYQVFRGSHPDEIQRLVYEGKGTRFTDHEVRPGVTYYYQVLAYNTVVEGPRSETVEITAYGTPLHPNNLVLTEWDGEIILSWSPPTNDGGRPVVEYVIRYGTSEVSMDEQDTVDALTLTLTVTGLDNGEDYFFAVSAVSDVGRGPETQILSASPLGLPGSPVDLKVVEGVMQVSLSWAPPSDDGGRPVTSFVVLRGGSGGPLERIEGTTDPSYEDTDVEAGTTYSYAVIAVTEAGEGPQSEEVTGTPRPVPTPPSSPRDLVVRQKGDGILLTWSAPTSEGSEPVTGYLIFRGEESDNLTMIGNVDATIFQYLDEEDLKNGKTYTYSVKAKNTVGPGAMALTVDQKFKKEEESPGFTAGAAVVVIASIMVAVALRSSSRRDSAR